MFIGMTKILRWIKKGRLHLYLKRLRNYIVIFVSSEGNYKVVHRASIKWHLLGI